VGHYSQNTRKECSQKYWSCQKSWGSQGPERL